MSDGRLAAVSTCFVKINEYAWRPLQMQTMTGLEYEQVRVGGSGRGLPWRLASERGRRVNWNCWTR
jgi:hypothetical protein